MKSHEPNLDMLSAVIMRVVSARNLRAAYDAIVATLVTSTGFEKATIEKFRSADGVMEVVGQAGYGRKLPTKAVRIPLIQSPSGAVVLTKKPIVYHRGTTREKEMVLLPRSIRTWVAVPLKSNRNVVGVLTLATRKPREVDPAFVLSFARLASEVAGLIAQKESEEFLKASEEKYRELFNGMLDAVLMFEPGSGTIIDTNFQATVLTGYDRSELMGRNLLSLFPPEELPAQREILAHMKKRRSARNFWTVHFTRKDGVELPVEINARRVSISEKKYVVAIARDISEQKKAEAKLAASEEFLRTIVEGTQGMFFFVLDAKGVLTYISPSVKWITGHSLEEWKGHYTRFLTPDPINEIVKARTEEALAGGQARPTYLCEIYHANGRPILLEVNQRPMLRDGRVVGVHGAARDITERKRLEEAILESRDHFNRLLEQTPVGVIVFNSRGDAIDVNGAWLRLFHVSDKAVVVGKLNVFNSPFTAHPAAQKSLAAAFAGEIVDSPPFEIQTGMLSPTFDPSEPSSSIHVKMFPVFDRAEKLVNVVALIEDVTDRRRLEEQLIQSQKMESIGLLAGGIAHDFNNILGAILGYASYLKTAVPRDDKIYTQLDTIERSALRAAELTAQLLAFSRGGKYVVEPVDLHDLIDETVRILRGTFDKNIELVVSFHAHRPIIEADSSQMQQVLMNLCVNARDAMPHGGRLMIATEAITSPDAFLRSCAGRPKGPFVKIAIADTGTGIAKKIRPRIYEPFFTTKEKGKGTGLGLATVYGIVENHGGFITFDTQEGKGTTFMVYLPTVDREVSEAPPQGEQSKGGEETILIVDDEEMIRALVRDILESKGYNVIEASSGARALACYREMEHSIDLVIIDMVMPGMGGGETLVGLKAINNGVKAILSTGYSEDERARELMSLGVKAFLQKPYRVDELASVVRKVLDDDAH